MSMTTTILVAGLLLGCSTDSTPADPAPRPPAAQPRPAQDAPVRAFDHTHAAWTSVLDAHVQGDRFDYAALARDRGPLDAYLAELATVTRAQLEAWTRAQRYAFWINAYNAFTVHLIVDAYPVASIKDLGSMLSPVWKKRFIPLGALDPDGEGQALSLDVVEHGILRPRFEDARVHAAVNCASESCPPLRNEAFVAERLDEQLDEQVRAWLADPRRNRYDRASEELRVSAIFDWFEDDFERDAGSVSAWIARYAPAAEAAWIRAADDLDVEFLDYSWELNAVVKKE